MSERFIRRFAAVGMVCALSLTAMTGARTLVLREQAGAEAAAALGAAVAGPPAGLTERLADLLASERRWRELGCYAADGTLRFEAVRTARGLRPAAAPSSAAGASASSLSTVALRIDGAAGRCAGRYRALNRDAVYPVIRDTAVAAILLLAIGALTLVAVSIRSRDAGPKPPPALAPPAGFTPGTAGSAPGDPESGTPPRTRHEPR